MGRLRTASTCSIAIVRRTEQVLHEQARSSIAIVRLVIVVHDLASRDHSSVSIFDRCVPVGVVRLSEDKGFVVVARVVGFESGHVIQPNAIVSTGVAGADIGRANGAVTKTVSEPGQAGSTTVRVQCPVSNILAKFPLNEHIRPGLTSQLLTAL